MSLPNPDRYLPQPENYLPLYLVTDTAQCGTRGLPAVVAAAIEGGVSCVQLRDKQASARGLLALLLAVAGAVDGRVPLLVNDRVDVFLAARHYLGGGARISGARVDGVHVGQSDLPAESVRALVGPDAIVGLSASTPAELAAAAALPPGTVDYFGVGAVHPTTTKADHPDPLGVTGFARFAAASPLPCVAIGGVKEADAAALKSAGAAGIAVVSAICAAPDPAAAARTLAKAWHS